MTYYRMNGSGKEANSRTPCGNCRRPFRDHKYVTTDRDGDLYECPDETVPRTKASVHGSQLQRSDTRVLTPLQVQDAVIAWALAHGILTFKETAHAAVTIPSDGGAKIRIDTTIGERGGK